MSTAAEAPSARFVRVVLYEGEGARALEPERRAALVEALLDGGYAVVRPGAERMVTELAVGPGSDVTYVVLADFEGDAPEIDAGGATVRVEPLADREVEEIVRSIGRSPGEGGEAPAPWKPWFPVIDYDRCTNCMQCLTFCLFDVYGVDAGQRIQVQNHDHCKTDCPACSRVCPEAAILFPKYKAGPINGDEVKPEDLKREAMKVDISALLGGDIYAALKQRSAEARKRFSTERDESKALLERKRCLKKLQKDLDIPPEVLMTLPSVEDIEARAERAREKARRRMERSRTMQDEKEKRPPSPDEWGI